MVGAGGVFVAADFAACSAAGSYCSRDCFGTVGGSLGVGTLAGVGCSLLQEGVGKMGEGLALPQTVH